MEEDVALSRDLKRIADLLEECVRILARPDGISHGTVSPAIGSKFAEFWVANRLAEYQPQIWKSRNKGGADIYLRRIDKNIEVKYSTLRSEWKTKWKEISDCNWGWAFGKGKQFEDKRFDFCVLVAAAETGAPEKCFVIPVEDFHHSMKKRKGVYPEDRKGSYCAIDLFRAREDYNSWKRKVGGCPLEDVLNEHPERYENKWDLIK
jgi:hypothetical protein